jgi:hypothetical protein
METFRQGEYLKKVEAPEAAPLYMSPYVNVLVPSTNSTK